MGIFDWDGDSVVSSHSHKSSRSHHKTSKSRDSSRARSHRGSKHNGSGGSFFGLGNGSTRSFFSLGGHSSSYYKRQPRSSFMQRTLKKLKRLLRDLVYYAKRHPIKVFMLVIMPLITGGALTALLARFGLRLPPAIERLLGVAARAGSGGGSVGLVGEAVRMVSGAGASSSSSSSSSSSGGSHYSGGGGYIDRGREGDFHWERRREQYHSGSGGDDDGGFLSSVKNFFS
ncbi:hypothetical protein AAE478_001135 [Parahypoxylon ruwenzoriense]